jgi:hypothetical protein
MNRKEITILSVISLFGVLVLVSYGFAHFTPNHIKFRQINPKPVIMLEKGKQYPVESFNLNEDTTFTLILKEDKAQVKVDYKNYLETSIYYCDLKSEFENNLKGNYIIQLSEVGHIRLSEDLFKAIKSEIANVK